MRAFVSISKFGDCASTFPIIYDEFKRTGQLQHLLIGKEFKSLAEGCSYIVPHIWEGKWGDLSGAIRRAKMAFDDVVVLQTHGENFPIKQITPSFQTEQYLRGGVLGQWDKLPLIFDNRNKGRERALRKKVLGTDKRPFILVGDASQSSPFLGAAELLTMLEKEFGETHRILKLSEIKAEYIFDLLGLYDKADALITAETVHVHLSKASKVPTFVLAADGWRGSQCVERFKFYCRYAEWERRKNKLILEIKAVLSGQPAIKIHTVPTLHDFGYNLSTIRFEGGTVGVYRYHEGSWQTKLALDDGERTHTLKIDGFADNGFSYEDLRLFVFKDKLHGAYTVSRADHQNQFKGYQAYGEIKEADSVWSIGHIQVRRVGNDFTGTEKNWLPFTFNECLFFVYGVKGDNQIVLQVEGDKILAEHQSPAPKWANGQIKGGCIIPHGKNLLRFFHSRADYGKNDFRYFIGAALMENKPPFATLAVSKASILAGTECFTPGCSHWKKNCCLPYGVVKQDDKFLLSIGINDCQCAVAELTEADLKFYNYGK